ncbi:hybrid sensor histidine kinase/response regulator transcription factor, partial [Phocaeicola massiliensis]|uniref:hybrid sensor histidine kinase/response regulator transcription factor n=1 Tax=Phocaeicola massiliensis TaxID=204516 RepID=UPI0022DFF014
VGWMFFCSLLFRILSRTRVINNQKVVAGDETGVLTKAFPYTQKLKLSHNQNNLILSFALPDYEQQLSQKQFQYKLDGFDKKWIKTSQTEVHYTNLDPGTYTLRVAAINNSSNQSGDITDKEISMQLTISAPWYATWWAFLLYIISFIGCLYYFISSRIAKRTLALSLEKERFEKQQIEQLNQEKLVFFTNVSHEFRTPLTLIISHIDIILQKSSLNPSIYNQILKIRKNAQQMSNLISELLEFRKLEQNHKTLQISQQDITPFLKEIYFSFVDYAHLRNIHYDFQLSETPTLCWFDSQLLEKVFFNLLSNAFKYTPDNGNIIISGRTTDNEVEISISDTGSGIAKNDVSQIFARFFQANNQKPGEYSSPGTGIGLALSKTIVEKHHGTITVDSTLGKGSTFTVRLPRNADVFQADKNIQLSNQQQESSIVPGSLDVLPETDTYLTESVHTENAEEKTHTVLLVEDNEELLQLLTELFSPFYEVICATNGEEGLKQVYEHKIDLIISDIMMPKMSGTEMCLQIKNNIDYCHIPLILLTALNSTEQNIEGLNRGADDYITKPFHAQLLLARANNLIRSRLLMQHQFDKKPISEIDLTCINPLDKDILKRTAESIEQHIDDTEYDIPVLCKEVGIGRSLLYTKFKALTGMTPNNFILNYRLKHAAALLQQYPDIPIAEVSDRCGFSSPVYFSRCFKNQYGCTPQNYRKEKKTES